MLKLDATHPEARHMDGSAAARSDLIAVGGGSAGLPATIFATRRCARVLLIDHAEVLGGTLWVATGQMSATGTRLQRARGIEDTPDLHFEDVMRISRETANPGLVRRDGPPVPNVYTAGEILGSSQTMGQAACGGMMVAPATTFARLLRQNMIPLDCSR